MLILSFESSAKAASVALLRDGELVAEYTQCSALTHSRTLLPMAEDMLKNTETKMDEVDVIACAMGPGSFTGIRIGVATVKGLAWALEKPCTGVSTLEAMAWNGISSGGIVCCVMDARRNQVYNALFRIENGAPVRLCEDRAISLQELIADLQNRNHINDAQNQDGVSSVNNVFLVGDGAEITAKAFETAGVSYTVAPGNLRYQSAWGVAKAAEDKTPGTSESLLPVYLRLSQAERERNERLAREAAAGASGNTGETVT